MYSEDGNFSESAATRDSDADKIPWAWRERTRARIVIAYEFCLVGYASRRRASSGSRRVKKEVTDTSDLLGPVTPLSAAGGRNSHSGNIETMLTAVGVGLSPAPARRGVLSEGLFRGVGTDGIGRHIVAPESRRSPDGGLFEQHQGEDGDSFEMPQFAVVSKEKGSKSSKGAASSSEVSYPFVGRGVHASSGDKDSMAVPWPPSPRGPRERRREIEAEAESAVSPERAPHSSTSVTMSSLGHSLHSGTVFQETSFSLSSGAASRVTPYSYTHSDSNSRSHSNSRSTNSRSMQSRAASGATRSTRNGDSTDSRSHYTSSSGPSQSGLSQALSGFPLSPPPRYSRARAGTVPIPASPTASSSNPASQHLTRPRARTRTGSGFTSAFGTRTTSPGFNSAEGYNDQDPEGEASEDDAMMEQPEPEGSYEAAEGDDFVGLLESHPSSRRASLSPKSSLGALRHRASNSTSRLRERGSQGSSSGSGSNRSSGRGQSIGHSRSGSVPSSRRGSVSLSMAIRSRAQSLVQTARSSVELIRHSTRRDSSMTRLEDSDDVPSSPEGWTRPRSGSDVLMGAGDHTFGRPIPVEIDDPIEEAQSLQSVEPLTHEHLRSARQESRSSLSPPSSEHNPPEPPAG